MYIPREGKPADNFLQMDEFDEAAFKIDDGVGDGITAAAVDLDILEDD
jgi:hypothetical protein